jgi:PBSX family phage terminase large subunit
LSHSLSFKKLGIDVVPKIAEGFCSDRPITLFYGWRDGGKSTSLAKLIIPRMVYGTHFRGIHVRKHYNELALSTYKNLEDRVKELGLEHRVDLVQNHFKLTSKLNPNNYIFGAGADNPDKVRSSQDINFVWFEEFHDANESDFDSIYGTLRAKADKPIKFVATFNNDKVSTNSFIYKSFFDKSSPLYDKVERVHISHLDNPYIDQVATKDKLMTICRGDEDKYNKLVGGEFVNEETGGYYFGLETIPVKMIPYNPNEELLISFDLNYDPVSVTFLQKYNGKIKIIKTMQNKGLVADMALLVKYYLQEINCDWFKVTGDHTSEKADTRTGTRTDFDIIAEVLEIPRSQIVWMAKTNPNHGYSKDLINHLIYKRGIEFDESCTDLLHDFKIAKADNHGGLFKDREIYKMDLLDSARYGIHYFVPTIKEINNMTLS